MKKRNEAMKDQEAIRALEICFNDGMGCGGCPMYEKYSMDMEECRFSMAMDVIDLIKRQKAEIEKLNVELVGMRGACESYKIHYDNAQAEIESLKAEIVIRDKIIDERGKEVIRHDNAIRSLHKQLDNLKSEAIKEFVERLREKGLRNNPCGGSVDNRDIDNLLAEMESEGE